MIEQIKIYSKPTNKYNIKGRFYNLYLNKINNLNLSSLKETHNEIYNIKTNKIYTSNEIYNNMQKLLLSLKTILDNLNQEINTLTINFQQLIINEKKENNNEKNINDIIK